MVASTDITNCRICKSDNLMHVISLGKQELTGVFPKSKDQEITSGDLDLVWCRECGLLQMKQAYDLGEMYGNNYGYRSGLNQTMVDHLTHKIHGLEHLANLQDGDLVLDIGSNDSTSLRAYTRYNCEKVGIDPTGIKFKEYYPDDIKLIPDFFTAGIFKHAYGERKAKIITSIAMFYDLPDPNIFVEDIKAILADDGVWHIEQSYMPTMLRMTSYDMICHEHLEFYSLRVLANLMEKHGMRIFNARTNAINGGSLALDVCKQNAPYASNYPVLNWMLQQETTAGLSTGRPYVTFRGKVAQHRDSLVSLIDSLVADGKTIFGYGASTKGNVILQYCGFTEKQIPYIAEVNADKYGCYSPGTYIPIIPDKEAMAMNPDYYLVLPWAFRQNILEKEKEYIRNGGRFIFPLPEIEIV